MGQLLERDEQLRLIDEAIDAASQRNTGVVMVLGAPGIGKTSLLEAAIEHARDRGFRVRSSAFTPVSDTGAAALLWDLFPEAAAAGAAVDTAGNDGSGEGSTEGAPFQGPARHIVDAVYRKGSADAAMLAYGTRWALGELAATQTQLIAVDDLHWADEASLQLLTSLALRLRGERVLFVFTSRQNEQAEGTLAALLASPTTVLLEPKPLTASAVAELANRAGHAESSDGADPEKLHELSEGNPFYVREILQRADGSQTRLISSVQVRLSLLSLDARDAVETLAVAREPIPLAVLRLATQAHHAQLRSALSELRTSAFVATNEGLIRIVPPILIEAISRGLTPERRSELHERIAAAMHQEGMPLSEITPHEMNSQPSGDQRRIAVLVEAAQLAEAAGRPAVAAESYARARHEGGLDETRRIELTLKEGRARTVAGDGEAGLALISEAVRGIADPHTRGKYWAELGDLAYMAGSAEASAAAYEHARAVLEGDGEASEQARLVLAKTLASEGTLHTEVWATVLTSAEEAAVQDEGVLDRADAAFAAIVALTMVLMSGPSAKARQIAERAFAAGLEPGGGDDPIAYVLSGALGNLAMIDEAEQWLGAALTDVRDRGSIFGAATASYSRGMLRFRFGRIRAGLADLEASWSGIGLGWHTYFYSIRHYLTLALLRTGDRERAISVASTLPRGHDSAFPLIGRMTDLMLALEIDDVEAAVRHADSLLGTPNPFVHAGIEWRPQMAEAYLRRGQPGDTERARLLIRDALDQLGEQALPLNRAVIIFEAARLAHDAEAEALYAQVIELVGSTPAYEAAASHLALARFAVARGELDHARTLVRLALDYAMREGARPLSTEAYDLLMLIDPSPSLIDADKRLATLSASELRIAAAAASGLNNRQIAQDHFVTMRTVEFHLTNVYRKLSISGRDELRRIIPTALNRN